MRFGRSLCAGLAAAALLSAPVTLLPAPAQAQVAGLSANDRALGAQAHPGLVQEFGGAMKGPLADYVERVGRKVALAASPQSQPTDWTVTLLNSPVPNAMATPGGYIYMTRGLMAMMNSEAELAAVLGHEIGHVTARHSNKRNSRATIAGIGSILAGVFLGSEGAQIANTVGSGVVATYSRGQEHESDELGMQYAVAAGYDPRAAAEMLAALDRVSAVEGRASMERGGLQSIFASHPVTRERIDRVARLASQMPAGGVDNSAAFLTAIDGMAFGDAADQGLVQGTRFRHGTLRFGFEAPQGFTLQNSPRAVTGTGPNGAKFQFQGVAVRPEDSLESVVHSAWSSLLQGSLPQISSSTQRVNQLERMRSSAQATSGRNRVDLGITAYRFAPDTVYLFTTVAPAGRGAMFDPLLNSLRRLTDAEARVASQGRRIQVVTVRAGDTPASLAARMSPPYNRAESLLALNGITDGKLRPGERIKLIVD